jgi:hypothetical protein
MQPKTFKCVTRGLNPRVHPFRKKLDCRVQPGNDSKRSIQAQ